MPRNLLCVVLIAELGCWSASEPAPEPRITKIAPRAPETCTQSGDRLEVVACRQGNNLAWTVTNRTAVPLWAFVAPPAGGPGAFSRDNAVVIADRGHVVLMKLEPPLIEGERFPTGAVLLAPGASDQGSVPIGERINPQAKNLSGLRVTGTAWVVSVQLEVGFAEQHPTDNPQEVASFMVLTGFRRARQELVRTPVVPWR